MSLLAYASYAGAVVLALPVLFWATQAKPLPGIPHHKHSFFNVFWELPSLLSWMSKNGSISQYLHAQADMLGPISQIIIGPRRFILLCDAQEIDDVLTKRKEFERSEDVVIMFRASAPGAQIVLMTDAKWKLHRRVFGPAMSNHHLKQMAPRITRCSRDLIELWDAKRMYLSPKNGTKGWSNAFDVCDDIIYLTTDAISSMVLGHDFGCTSSAIRSVSSLPPLIEPSKPGEIFRFPHEPSERYKFMRYLWQSMNDIFDAVIPSLQELIMTYTPKWRAAQTAWQNFIRQEIINRREERVTTDLSSSNVKEKKFNLAETEDWDASGDTADCVVSMALGQGAEEKLSPQELEDEVSGLVFAGQDTASSVISWAVKHFSRAPQVQKILHAELKQLIASTYGVDLSTLTAVQDIPALTFADLNSDQTPYLEAVVAECLRCSATLSIVPRDTKENTAVLGKAVPKGSVLYCLTSHSGNDFNTQHHITKSPSSWLIPSNSPIRSQTSATSGVKMGVWDDDGSIYTFKPERWIDWEDGKMVYNARKGWNMQFGAGPRGCFGKQAAMLELRLALATLNLAFFLDPVPEEVDDMEAKDIISVQPIHCYVNPKRWSDVE